MHFKQTTLSTLNLIITILINHNFLLKSMHTINIKVSEIGKDDYTKAYKVLSKQRERYNNKNFLRFGRTIIPFIRLPFIPHKRVKMTLEESRINSIYFLSSGKINILYESGPPISLQRLI